ncbi:MAG: GNAT family N-acetyltransferase [Elusimicrobia bacterium]|nr:MAG: GNAT family N-acetyltransferase [Elusimicrobiota bacterium]
MTDTITLRDAVEADIPALFEFHSDPEANKKGGFVPRTSEAFTKHFTENVLGKEEVIKKAILLDGKLVGYLLCFYAKTQWEVGYWIRRGARGKGVATNSMKAFLALLTNRPLFARVAQRNIGSVKVLEKLGFERVEEYIHTNEAGEKIPDFLYKLA